MQQAHDSIARAVVFVGLLGVATAAPSPSPLPETDWFSAAGRGVFTHYLHNLQNAFGSNSLGLNTTWDQCVDEFDVDAYAAGVVATGARYAFITIMQGDQYMIAPNSAFDRYTGYSPGQACASRDLVLDLWGALTRRGLKLGLYFTGGGPRRDAKAARGLAVHPDPAGHAINMEFVGRWAEVLQEYSVRYGDKVFAWWLDGCYFDAGNFGYNDTSLKPYHDAIRTGNPQALIAFNAGVRDIIASGSQWFLPARTHMGGETSRWEDFTAGETDFFDHFDQMGLPTSRWATGPTADQPPAPFQHSQSLATVQWHMLSFLGSQWAAAGHCMCSDGPHPNPTLNPNCSHSSCVPYSSRQLKLYTQAINSVGGVLTSDLQLFRNGSLNQDQVAFLHDAWAEPWLCAADHKNTTCCCNQQCGNQPIGFYAEGHSAHGVQLGLRCNEEKPKCVGFVYDGEAPGGIVAYGRCVADSPPHKLAFLNGPNGALGCTNLTGMWHGPHDPWVNITQKGVVVKTVAPWGSGSGTIEGYVVTMQDVNHNGVVGTHTIELDASCSVWKDTSSDTWTRCVVEPCEPFVAPPASVVVDFSTCLRATPGAPCQVAQQVGSGILLSINETHPRGAVISPLGLRNHRGDFDNLQADFGRLRAMHIDGSVQSVLMDLYFGRGMNPPPKSQAWIGDDGNWTHWTDFVSRTVFAAPDGLAMDIWNEPDGGTFWARSYQQYLDLWAHGVRAARAVRPNVTIVGPSIAHFSTEWMGQFLNDCANLLVLPDIISWHEWGNSGSDIPGHVAATRKIVASLGQHASGRCSKVSINEMVPKQLNFNPGVHVSYFANLERAHVDSACHSCWPEPTKGEVCSENRFGPGVGDNCGQWGPQCKGGLTLDGLLTCDGKEQPRSVWWAYKAYGAVQGQLKAIHGSALADGVAAVATDGTATVAVGMLTSQNATLRLHLQNLPTEMLSSSRSYVNVSIALIENTGVAALSAPRVSDHLLQVAVAQSNECALLVNTTPGSALFIAIGKSSANIVGEFARSPLATLSKTDDDASLASFPRPAITWVSDPVRDGELVMLQAVHHDNLTTVLLTKLGAASPQLIQPTRIGQYSIFFVLPEGSTSDSGSESLGQRYTVQLQRGSDHVRSEIAHINQPSVWWFQGNLGNSSSPGGWLRIFGTSLYLNSGNQDQTMLPRAHLCPIKNPVSSAANFNGSSSAECLVLLADGMNASSFHARFRVPLSIPIGNYRLSISNVNGTMPTAVASFVYDQGAQVNTSTLSICSQPTIRTRSLVAVRRFSVLDFGATGRSYNDASSAVRAAVAAAAEAIVATNSTTRAEVYFPRGRYILDVNKSGLIIPSNANGQSLCWTGQVVLVGEARHLASIYFQEYNTSTAPKYYLRGDGGPFGIQSLTMYVTGFFGSGSEAHGGVVSMAGTGAFLTDVRLHANSMAGLETVGSPNRGRVAYWGHFSLGILVSLANARNFEVSESYLYSEFQIFDTECAMPGAAFGLIQRNKIWNGAEIYRWCQANQIIFEHNECVSVTNNGGGGDIANYGEVPSSTHLWIADNSIHWTWGSDREVTTFDGGGSGYTGFHETQHYGTAAGRQPTIVLSMPMLSTDASIYPGWAIFVLDGPGAGQYRRIVQAHSRTELVLDSLFVGLVPQVSLLQVVPMRGQVIMFNNHIADTGVLQFYGQAMESVVAHHRHERTDGFISIGTVEGTYNDFDRNCSTASCQFGVNLQLQFLDNTVSESNHMWIWNQKQSQGEGSWDWHNMYNEYSFVAVGRNVLKSQWDGPMSRNLVYRRNRVVGYGGFGISDKTTDVILESCDVVNTTVGIHINESTTNVMTRNNSVSSE